MQKIEIKIYSLKRSEFFRGSIARNQEKKKKPSPYFGPSFTEKKVSSQT